MNHKRDKKTANVEVSEELQELEKHLKETSPGVFNGMPPKKKEQLLRSISYTLIQEKSHSGPLPDAETLERYNSIIPNGADRIMQMAENQQNHRMNIESEVISSNSSQSRLGQFFGFAIGVFGIGCGTFLAYNDHETVGGIIAGGTVISLVSVFVIGKKSQQKEE